jgi:hypothetical protein
MRLTTLAALTLCAATRLAAQAPDKATMLADWERTRANLLAYVDAAPDSMMGFRPTPGVRTYAEQFVHVVETNVEVGAMAVRGLPRAPVLGDSARYLHDKAALHAYVAASYDYALAAIREASPDQLNRISRMYGQPAAPAWRWIQLAHEHSIWTFGQIVPYLRLCRVTPPSYAIPL